MLCSPPESKAGKAVAALSACLREIEARWVLGPGDGPRTLPTGWPDIDAALPGGGLRLGAVHEWVGMAGFSTDDEGMPALPAHGTRTARWTPPASILAHLAANALAFHESRGSRRWCVWIGRRVWPAGWALARGEHRFPEDTESVARSDPLKTGNRWHILIDAPDAATRLWAIDLALRSPASSIVIADASGLDLSASRRLQLAAEAGAALGLLARAPAEWKQPTAAATRWLVAPDGLQIRPTDGLQTRPTDGLQTRPTDGLQIRPTNSCEVSSPRWIVRLLRCKGVQPSTEAPRRWALAMDHATSALAVSAGVGDRPGEEDGCPGLAVRGEAGRRGGTARPRCKASETGAPNPCVLGECDGPERGSHGLESPCHGPARAA